MNWELERTGGDLEREGMVRKEDITSAITRESLLCSGVSEQAPLGIQSSRTIYSLGKDYDISNTDLKKSIVVDRSDEIGKRADALRKATPSRTRKMVREQWKEKWLDSIVDGFAFQKLADTTKQQYQRRVCKYLDRVWGRRGEDGTLLGNIKDYLEELSEKKPILVAMFREELQEKEILGLDEYNQIIVKEANKKNPTKRHLAEALSLLELGMLVLQKARIKLSRGEGL